MPGYAAIFLALITTLVAAVYSLKNHSARRPLQTVGVRWYQLSAACVAAASLYLLYLILSGQYQYAYVFSYSSRDLPLAYKLSAFWAGQEGSFLLWLAMHTSFGLILLRQKDFSPAVMAVYCGLQLLLTLFLLVKSPFMMLLQPPPDGNGLNPLLQDPWMVIHPPIVFLGYAGLAVPFAYAVGSLLDPGARSWLRPALPWALLSWGALGAGIFIGGFWAYKVLGWGGYWAWDPVENSSLVPWLAAGALVHLMFLACLRPAGMRHAVMAALGSYVLVLYGTFLTRSGVLSDFSTHSFADEGSGGLLGAAVLAVAVACAVALILRWEELPQGELYPAVKSREFMLACTALILSMLAALVFVGMSTPVFTVLLGQAQNISPSFYNTTTLPLAVALAVLLAAGPLYSSGSAIRLRRYWWALIAAHGGIYLAVSHGIYHPLIITVAFFAAGGLLVNLHAAYHKTISRPAGLAHAGAALLLLGIVVSSAGSQSVNVTFEPGQSRLVFGQNLTYQGMERFPSGNGYYHNFRLDGSDIQSLTKLTKEGSQAAREPAIYRTALSDLYVAPVTAREKPPGRTLILRKGEEADVEGIRLRYLRAVMSSPKADGEDIHIRAYLEASRDGRKEDAAAELAYHAGRVSSQPVAVLGSLEVNLLSVNPAEGAVTLAVRSLTAAPPVDSLMTEISRKPLISLVWLGTVLITAGTCWAGCRRQP